MPLTKEDLEQIGGIAAEAATKAAEKAMAEPIRKFTPAVGEEKTIVSNMVTPEDKILADPKGGFKRFGEFAYNVYKAGEGGRHMTESLARYEHAYKVATKAAGYMEEGDLAQGGYAVPVGFVAEIQQQALEEQIVRPRARQIPMSTNRVEIPVAYDNTHASGTYYGITFYRAGEGNQRTASNPKLAKVALQLHGVDGLVHVTNELLEDSPVSMMAFIEQSFPPAIGAVQDDDFLLGTGANMAVGAFASQNPCLVTASAVSGQGASTIIAENIIQMWSQVPQRCQRNAIWVANNDTFPQLAAMGLSVGAGGIPVWMPANGLAGSPYGLLMGKPLILSEKMQSLGTAGDIGIADFSQYWIGEKAGGIQFASSIHLKFDYNETSFRFTLRYDGTPSWPIALTPRRSSTTLSPFVILSGSRT
jgi:HK97 family phage major capsid protein